MKVDAIVCTLREHITELINYTEPKITKDCIKVIQKSQKDQKKHKNSVKSM